MIITRLFNELLEEINTGRELLCEMDNDEDAMKSLNYLVKSNNGAFKSAAQAKFMYNNLIQRRDVKAEQGWAKKYMSHPDAYVVYLMNRIKQFGSTTQSKVRYYGFYYVIDGGGVIAMAKALIDHKEKSFLPVGVKEISFERKGNVPILYSKSGEAERIKASREKNKDLISKLEAVPGYNENDFLQDIVYQMEHGKDLTPGQLRAISKYVSIDDNSLEKENIKKDYDKGMDLLERVIVAPALAYLEPVSKTNENAARIYKDIFESWKNRAKWRGKMEIEVSGSWISNLIGYLGYNGRRTRWMITNLIALRLITEKGLKAPKWALGLVSEAKYFISWLEKKNPQETTDLLREMFPA